MDCDDDDVFIDGDADSDIHSYERDCLMFSFIYLFE